MIHIKDRPPHGALDAPPAAGSVGNLIPVTLGGGGGGFVALVYWLIYLHPAARRP